jgi:hypothetical protein
VIFNSVLDVTCDLSAKLYLPAELTVTCDQPKILADHMFGGVLLPHMEMIFIINHFVTLRASGGWPCDTVTPAKFGSVQRTVTCDSQIEYHTTVHANNP